MAVNVGRYSEAGQTRWGVIHGDKVHTLSVAGESTEALMNEGWDEAWQSTPVASDKAVADIEWLCPVTPDRQLICQGLNYSSHLREVGFPSGRMPFNTFFRKASSCLCPGNSDIVRPSHVRLLDYEIELGLVLRRVVTGPEKVTAENLAEYVGALVLHNDVSARDVQLPQVQFYKGKSYRTFGPTGPWLTLVNADDLARLDDVALSLSVNGSVRQQATAADLSYKPWETLTELSEIQDLAPGDLVVTGTPGGTAVKSPGAMKLFIAKLLPDSKRWKAFIETALQDPDYLQDGDLLELSAGTADGAIDLGRQQCRVVAEVTP